MTDLPILWRPGDGPFSFVPPRRPVSRVGIHCSASDRPEHDDAAVMDSWHRARGWDGIGYTWFVRRDGAIQAGRDTERKPAAHAPLNTDSLAVCLHGLTLERFTVEQLGALVALAQGVDAAFRRQGVDLRWFGHNEISAKACPVIDPRRVLGLDARGRMTGTPDPTPVGLPGPPLPEPRRILGLFDRGEDVRALQAALNRAGVDAGAEDGIFGQVTRLALEQFQASAGLTVDGLAGPRTFAALRAAL